MFVVGTGRDLSLLSIGISMPLYYDAGDPHYHYSGFILFLEITLFVILRVLTIVIMVA